MALPAEPKQYDSLIDLLVEALAREVQNAEPDDDAEEKEPGGAFHCRPA